MRHTFARAAELTALRATLRAARTTDATRDAADALADALTQLSNDNAAARDAATRDAATERDALQRTLVELADARADADDYKRQADAFLHAWGNEVRERALADAHDADAERALADAYNALADARAERDTAQRIVADADTHTANLRAKLAAARAAAEIDAHAAALADCDNCCIHTQRDDALAALAAARNELADERDARHNAEGNAYASERARALADNADERANDAEFAALRVARATRTLAVITDALADAHTDAELLARAAAIADAHTHDKPDADTYRVHLALADAELAYTLAHADELA